VDHTSKRKLFSLVEALCEETATAEDLSQLEQLVLQDAELRRLYLELITLHGLLHWDAAGQGAELESSAVTAAFPLTMKKFTRRSQPRHFRRLREITVGLAVLVILKLSFAYFIPAKNHVARDPAGLQKVLPTDVSSPTNPPAFSKRQQMVPSVHLSRNQNEETPSLFSGRRVEESVIAINPAASESTFQLGTDAEVIARINHHLNREWKQAGVQPAVMAQDPEWVRRVYLDLAGRIPTRAEAGSFLASSQKTKRAVLVDRLLSSRDFSRRLATVWTNLLVGRARETNVDRQTLLNWLDEEFFSRRSWRETVTDLVSARGTSQASGPANFLLAHLNNEAVPATAITSRIFLCEQLQCTQCHPHPSVKGWGQERFWELNAFFQQARIQKSTIVDRKTGKTRVVRELVDAEIFGPTYYETLRGVMRVAYPKFAGVEISKTLDESHPTLRTQLAGLLFADAHPQPARAFVNRTWNLLMGRGFTFPVDDMGPHTPVSHPELLEDLTVAFVQSHYDVARLVRWISLSDAYQLSSRPGDSDASPATTSGDRPLFHQMEAKPLAAEQLFDSLRIASGQTPEQLRSGKTQREREQWLRQFYSAVDTEENGEETTFDGSWQQTLMMINGDLVQRAVSMDHPGVLTAIVSPRGLSEADRIRQLSLAALSRYPSPGELTQLRDLVRRSIRQRVTEENLPSQVALTESLRDVYWAYLNSSEFAVNH